MQPIAAECWRERDGKLSRILGKNTIFNEHPVAALTQSSQELVAAAKLGQLNNSIVAKKGLMYSRRSTESFGPLIEIVRLSL